MSVLDVAIGKLRNTRVVLMSIHSIFVSIHIIFMSICSIFKSMQLILLSIHSTFVSMKSIIMPMPVLSTNSLLKSMYVFFLAGTIVAYFYFANICHFVRYSILISVHSILISVYSILISVYSILASIHSIFMSIYLIFMSIPHKRLNSKTVKLIFGTILRQMHKEMTSHGFISSAVVN